MRRIWILMIALPVLAALAYGGASWADASGNAPDIPEALAAAALPKVAVAAPERLRLAAVLDREPSTRFGLTDDSFNNARILATTAKGDLVAIPGTAGLCLLLDGGLSCGARDGVEPVLVAILVADSTGKTMIGGGIANVGVSNVIVTRGDGSKLVIPVKSGVFTIGSDAKILPREELSFSGS